MNEFNLYRLTNFDAEQLINPLKRTTLLLGFIKGPNVKDWVRRWTMWTVNEYTTGRPSVDEHYWTTIMDAFQHTFQDTGACDDSLLSESLKHEESLSDGGYLDQG